MATAKKGAAAQDKQEAGLWAKAFAAPKPKKEAPLAAAAPDGHHAAAGAAVASATPCA